MTTAMTTRKLRGSDKSLRIGLFWPYSTTPIPSLEVAKRNPDVLDLQNHLDLAKAVEEIQMDFALIGDGYAPGSEASSRTGFQDPSTNAVILAVPLFLATKNLGFISTLHTRFLHPVVIARLAAHLDWVSGGRWGWNIVNGFRDHEAQLFGFDGLDHDGGYDLADEALEVVKQIWADPNEGVHHHGNHFKVDGRIRKPVPPTVPLLVSAASSARGRRFASKHCDYLFASPGNAQECAALAADLEKQSGDCGRADRPRILILCSGFIRDEPGRAREEYAQMMESQDKEAAAVWAAQITKLDKKPSQQMLELHGTTDEVAEEIVELCRNGAAGGLIIRPPIWKPEEVRRFGPVMERLGKAGLWQPPRARGFAW